MVTLTTSTQVTYSEYFVTNKDEKPPPPAPSYRLQSFDFHIDRYFPIPYQSDTRHNLVYISLQHILLITMSSNNRDYSNTHFVHSPLDCIRGKPKYESLKIVKDQLKTNAQTVGNETTFGYLGLVLTQNEFARISNVPFTKPINPGTLNIPPFTAAHEYLIINSTHEDKIRKYKECQTVEKALLKQLVQSFDPEYMKPFRNALTNAINTPLPDILAHLFRTYGRVTSEQLKREDDKMTTFVWNPNDSPDILYNSIEELRDFAIAAKLPKTPEQIVNYGLDAILKTGAYERALMDWYARPEAERTWFNFKLHFTDAQDQLRRVRGDTMNNTAFQQANLAMQQEVRKDFEAMRDEVVHSINLMAESIETPPTPQQIPTPPVIIPQATVNNTTNSTTMSHQELLAAFTTLTATVSALESRLANTQQPPSTTNRRNGGGNGRIRNTNGGYRSNINLYCWTHGACNHGSKDCKNPRDGHKAEATFENRMNGSSYFCRRSEDQRNNN